MGDVWKTPLGILSTHIHRDDGVDDDDDDDCNDNNDDDDDDCNDAMMMMTILTDASHSFLLTFVPCHCLQLSNLSIHPPPSSPHSSPPPSSPPPLSRISSCSSFVTIVSLCLHHRFPPQSTHCPPLHIFASLPRIRWSNHPSYPQPCLIKWSPH